MLLTPQRGKQNTESFTFRKFFIVRQVDKYEEFISVRKYFVK